MRPLRRKNAVAAWLAAACALAVSGCGESKYPSATATGRVTIDGVAVPVGVITFSPTAGTSGPVVGAAISNGAYRCEQVPQGKLQVTFIAQAAEPMTISHSADHVPHQVPKDILPPNCRAGQPAQIGPGENQLNFDLKSK